MAEAAITDIARSLGRRRPALHFAPRKAGSIVKTQRPEESTRQSTLDQ
jgi:hypothetical protein